MDEKTTDLRDRLMAALSVAEQLSATSPIQHYDSVTAQAGAVRVMLHQRPEDVAAWAGLHGLSLTLVTNYNDDQRPYVEADGVVAGVSVSVWALGDVGEQERYAVCVPVSEESAPGVAVLPQAWGAAAVSA